MQNSEISSVRCHFVQVDIYNIIGDELLLNFGEKFQR